MTTKTKTVVFIRTGNDAAATQTSTVSRRNRTGRLRLALPWALVVLALAWGLYESVMLLTGVIPKY